MEKIVSVIIPVYNVEKYIERCINSVISQTYKNIEIIVVDDGSTDNSSEKVIGLVKKYKNIKFITQKNKGLGGARNTGINNSKGEYLFFLDSDDWIKNNVIEYMLNVAINRNSDIVVAKMNYVFDNKKFNYTEPEVLDENIILNKIDGLKSLMSLKEFKFHACGKLFKKDLFDAIRFPEKVYYEDIATIYKVFLKANVTSFANISSYEYYMRDNSICNMNLTAKHLIFIKHLDVMKEYFILNGIYNVLEEDYKRLKLILSLQLGFRKIALSDNDIKFKYENYDKLYHFSKNELYDKSIYLYKKDYLDRFFVKRGKKVYFFIIKFYKILK